MEKLTGYAKYSLFAPPHPVFTLPNAWGGQVFRPAGVAPPLGVPVGRQCWEVTAGDWHLEEREIITCIFLAPSLPGCPLPVAAVLSPRCSAACQAAFPITTGSRGLHCPLSFTLSGKRWTQLLQGPFLAFLNPTVMS